MQAVEVSRVTTTRCATSSARGCKTTTIRASSAATKTIAQCIRPVATSTSTITARAATRTAFIAVARATTVTAAATSIIEDTSTTVFDLEPPAPTPPRSNRRAVDEPNVPLRHGARHHHQAKGKQVVCKPTVKVYSRVSLRPTSTAVIKATVRRTHTITSTSTVPVTFTFVPGAKSVTTATTSTTITADTVTFTTTPTAKIATTTTVSATATVTETSPVRLSMYCANAGKIGPEFSVEGFGADNAIGGGLNTSEGQKSVLLGSRSDVTQCCNDVAAIPGAVAYRMYATAQDGPGDCGAVVLKDLDQCIRGTMDTSLRGEHDLTPYWVMGMVQCGSGFLQK
ncbi:hypothetical protein V8E36_000687 [Tilletia maclaganii]